MIEEFLRQDSY